MSKYSVPHFTSVTVMDSYLMPRIAANTPPRFRRP
jgi:hypothetical protein